MNTSSWITIAAVCLTGAATPGPSLAVVIRNTVAGGRSQGMLTGLGHGLGVGIYAFSAVVGVAALLKAAPGVTHFIEILGGLYLIWMGIGALRNADNAEMGAHAVSGRAGFTEGFVIAFLNPKVAVFFLALLGSFLPPDAAVLESVGVALLAMAIDATWYILVALLLVTTGAADWLAVRGRGMGLVLGVLLLGIGSLLVISSLI
ncbi:MAG: threonine/homoserine/homoserine lactone efflux protein [Planctomycetota bacterium]|jgi:threonine/homoserine/homoserine lactone efflux protein